MPPPARAFPLAAAAAAVVIASALDHAQGQSLSREAQTAFAAAEAKGRAHACVGDGLAAARACALTKCRDSGARDCKLSASCQPAQWSATLSIAMQGSRTVLTFCSLPSRPGLIARLKDVCRSYRARGLETCTLESVWTPRGEEETAGLRWTRQTLGSPRSVSR
jgi:hypothetical protein